jgi:hypothetical protein
MTQELRAEAPEPGNNRAATAVSNVAQRPRDAGLSFKETL